MLGDFLKFKGDYFKAFEQEKHFEVNGVRFEGRIELNPDGALSVLVDKRRNPTDAARRLQHALVRRPRLLFSSVTGQWSFPPGVKLTVPFPLSAKKKIVFVGLLTAGYLAWFHALGYSWVLRMSESRSRIPRNRFFGLVLQALPKALYAEPMIGAVNIKGMTVPAFVLDQWLVLFPSFEVVDAYSRLRPSMTGLAIHFRPFIFVRT